MISEIDVNEGKIDDIEYKLDKGGAFHNFVNDWFTKIDEKMDTILPRRMQLISIDLTNLSSEIVCFTLGFLIGIAILIPITKKNRG